MTKANDMIIVTSEKGYSVSRDGKTVTSFTGKVLKLNVQSAGTGYYIFGIGNYDNQRANILVHRLQAYQKFGKKMFKKGIQVRHLDGNSMNNSWENISIGTQSDNFMDRPKDDRIRNASNPSYPHDEIISDHTRGLSYRKIMKKYGIPSKGTVSFIINNSLESSNRK